MPKSHSSQRRAAKHKKRRQARQRSQARCRKAEARRRPAAPSVGSPASARGVYDPHRAPAPADWLALDEGERLRLVTAYHERKLRPERRPPNMATHASLHVVVETQLASNQPPAAREALRRLMSDGLSRHDAIHAVGWVAIEQLKQAATAGEVVDTAAYEAALGELSRQSWLASAGVAEGPNSLSTRRRSD